MIAKCQVCYGVGTTDGTTDGMSFPEPCLECGGTGIVKYTPLAKQKNKTRSHMATKSKTSSSKGKNGDAKKSLADLWDDTDPSEANNRPSSGEHEVRLNKIWIDKSKPKKGVAAFVEYEVIAGEEEGKKLKQMYKLRDADLSKGPGLAFLMRDLALLGYEKVKGSKMEKVLKEISEEQPMVTINVKENGQYVNAFLQGSVEDATGDDDDDDDDDEGEGDEIVVGSKVTWEDDDGDDQEGEVVKINAKKGVATVKDDDDEEHKIDLDDLKLVDEDDDDDDDDEEEEKSKSKTKKKGKKDDDDDDDDDDEDDINIQVHPDRIDFDFDVDVD